MSYRKHSLSRHYLTLPVNRYSVCDVPGCRYTRRAWGMRPLLHKGKAYRG
jgi:hypothetical protein